MKTRDQQGHMGMELIPWAIHGIEVNPANQYSYKPQANESSEHLVMSQVFTFISSQYFYSHL